MPDEAVRLGVVASGLSADPREAARVSHQIGANGLQFEAQSTAVDLTELSTSGRREFLRVLASQDQQLIGLRANAGPSGFRPGADVDRALARIDKLMEAAAGLASPLLCLDLGPLPEATSPQAPKPAVTPSMAGLILLPNAVASQPASTPASPPPDPAFAAQVAAAMDELGRRADRYNVMLAFQSELASFASLAQAVAQLNCPWFGIDLDPVAILHDTWDIDEVFSQLGPLIRHVRGRDALSGTQGRTRAAVIGEGNVDWRPLLRNLDEAGFSGWISVDPTDFTDRLSAARTGLKHLRSIRDGT